MMWLMPQYKKAKKRKFNSSVLLGSDPFYWVCFYLLELFSLNYSAWIIRLGWLGF